jgi:hypothetical protein
MHHVLQSETQCSAQQLVNKGTVSVSKEVGLEVKHTEK